LNVRQTWFSASRRPKDDAYLSSELVDFLLSGEDVGARYDRVAIEHRIGQSVSCPVIFFAILRRDSGR
jgi:hypothetical protein